MQRVRVRYKDTCQLSIAKSPCAEIRVHTSNTLSILPFINSARKPEEETKQKYQQLLIVRAKAYLPSTSPESLFGTQKSDYTSMYSDCIMLNSIVQARNPILSNPPFSAYIYLSQLLPLKN